MKVSIIIPVYNSEGSLAKTMDSAIGQTWANKEIIVIDDGSTDKSYEIAKAFESDNVKVYKQKNKGACAARNFGLKKATGDFIQFLDADDLLSPQKIENQTLLLLKYGEDTISSCCWGKFLINPEEAIFPVKDTDHDYDNPIDWILDTMQGKGMGQTSIWLTPKSLIAKAGEWDENLLINQDGEFFTRVLLKAKSIKFCKSSFVYYRAGNKYSISQNINFEKVKSLLASYKSYEKNLTEANHSYEVKEAIGFTYLLFIYQYFHIYPELVEDAKFEYSKLNLRKTPAVGGRNFKILADIIGFENAIILKKGFYKIMNIS